jgi:hypothetical protein
MFGFTTFWHGATAREQRICRLTPWISPGIQKMQRWPHDKIQVSPSGPQKP